MSSGQQMPPWLQEQVIKLQQTQQNMQIVQAQRQQIEMEKREIAKALEELEKASSDDIVYKQAGSILVRSKKDTLIYELKEKRDLAEARSTVLVKQEERIKQSLAEQEQKINDMIRGTGGPPKPA